MPAPARSTSLWLCYGAMMCLAVAVCLPPVYLTTFSDAFGGGQGLDGEQLGRIPAVVFACLVLGILITGPLADRWGGKTFALLGLGCTCVGLAAMGAAKSYNQLLVGGGIMGFGAGVLDMVLSPIASALQPHRRAAAMNWLHSFYCTGAVATTLVGAGALYLGIPWQSICFAIIVFPAAIFLAFVTQTVPPLVADEGQRAGARRLLRRPVFLVALAAILLGGATEHGLAQWLPAFAETEKGCSKDLSALLLAGFNVGMILGRVLAAMLGRRIAAMTLMLICCGLSAVLLAVGCFFPVAAVALAACVAVGLTGSCLWPTMLGVTADRFPNGGATMFALLAAAGNAGCFAMPWVIGVTAARTGRLDLGLSTAVLCPVLMIGCLLWLKRRGFGDPQATTIERDHE